MSDMKDLDINAIVERIQDASELSYSYYKALVDRIIAEKASEKEVEHLYYYMIGVCLVQHRKYSDWSKEKSFDLAEILEFMRVYRIRIPRYIKRTRFYRKKLT